MGADRITALGLSVLTCGYVYLGLVMEVSFYNGVVGPHHWGLGLGGVIILLCTLIFAKPMLIQLPEGIEIGFRKTLPALVPLPVSLVVYSILLPIVGYFISTILLIAVTGKLFGGKTLNAVICAAVFTVVFYILFDVSLRISLPTGSLFK